MHYRVDRAHLHDLRQIVSEISATAKEAYDWNQKSLANEAGICQQTLSNLLSGKTRLPWYYTLVKLARATGYTIHIDRNKVGLKVADERRFA